jgi:diadenosine tetraphosphate (Ap4A) HIT family hydrolase
MAIPMPAERWEIGRNERWLLSHHPDPAPLAGWMLLNAVRHLGGPVDFTPAAAAAWGRAIQAASRLVRELTGCERVYAIAFGEGARHLHLHLIPRHAGEESSEAWAVADLYRAVAAGRRSRRRGGAGATGPNSVER